MTSRDRPNAALGGKQSVGLRFETEDDSLNYARDLAKRATGISRKRADSAGWIEPDGWMKPKIEGLCGIDYAHLALSPIRIPLGTYCREGPIPEVQATFVKIYGQDGLMFCRVGDVEKAPQEIICGHGHGIHQIRFQLHKHKERMEGLWDAPIRTSSGSGPVQLPFESTFTFSAREIRVFQGCRSKKLRRGIHRLIENRAKLYDNFEGSPLQILRNVV